MLLMLLMNSAENQVEYGELQKSVKHLSGINYFRKKKITPCMKKERQN